MVVTKDALMNGWAQIILNASLFALQVQQCSAARKGKHVTLLDIPKQARCEKNVCCTITTNAVWYIFRLKALSDLPKDA